MQETGEPAVVAAQRSDGQKHRDGRSVFSNVRPLALLESFPIGAMGKDVEAAEPLSELALKPVCVLLELLRAMQIDHRPLPDHLGGSVAEHPLRSGVENGDGSFRVSGDDRHAGRCVEHRFSLGVGSGELLLRHFSLRDVVREALEQCCPAGITHRVRVDLHPKRRPVFLLP